MNKTMSTMVTNKSPYRTTRVRAAAAVSSSPWRADGVVSPELSSDLRETSIMSVYRCGARRLNEPRD